MTRSTRFLIAGNGDVVAQPAVNVLRELLGVMPEARARDYLVKTCGYIDVTVADSKIRVRLRPEISSDLAVGALCYILADANGRRAVGDWFIDGAWHHELLPVDLDALFDRLSMLLLQLRLAPPERILRRKIAPNSLADDHALLKLWRLVAQPHQEREARVLMEFVNQRLDGRYVGLKIREPGPKFVFTCIGPGMPDCARAWTEKAIGLNLEHQPDRFYGRYCAEAYSTVALTGVPLLEEIDAVVEWPGYGVQRRTYYRLIAPARDAEGRRSLLGVSVPDNGIDLRSNRRVAS